MFASQRLGVEDWEQVVDRKVALNPLPAPLQAELDNGHLCLRRANTKRD